MTQDENSNTINRRDLGRIAAVGAAGLIAGRAKAAEMEVAVTGLPQGAGDNAVMRAVKDAARAATDFSWLSRGDSVLIKPVMNSGNPYPATTNPAGLRAMVELLKEKGAGRVLVCDMSGIEWVKLGEKGLERGSTRELMHNAGLAQAALSAGAELYLPEENGGWEAFSEQEPAGGANWKRPLMMPKIASEVDHIVLMPRCARHVLAGSTLGLKAAVGWWRTDSRLEYHHDAATLQEKTAEANTAPVLLEKQRLVLTAATKIITTFGPDDGYIQEPDTGLIIASPGVVAHDMVSLSWLIKAREATPANKMGMGKDPYSSQFMVANGNRLVVVLLGGARQATSSQTLARNDIKSINDDRVLARAFEIFGGRPSLKIITPDQSVPSEVIKDLERRTSV